MPNSKSPKGAFQGFLLPLPLHCPALVLLQLSQFDHFQEVLQPYFLQQEFGLSCEGSCFVLDWENSISFLHRPSTGSKVLAPLRTLLRPHAINPRYGVVKTKRKKTRPPERRKQVTTSEDENLLEHCAMTMHVTCVAMSLDKLEPERQHGTFCTTWQLFLQTQKNSLWPQANNSLSWS